MIAVAVHFVSALAAWPMFSQWMSVFQAGAHSAVPQPPLQRMAEFMQRFMGLSLLANLLQLAGYGAMVALLGSQRPALGRALIDGLKATPTMFLAIVF